MCGIIDDTHLLDIHAHLLIVGDRFAATSVVCRGEKEDDSVTQLKKEYIIILVAMKLI